MFSQSVIEKIKFYVYILKDPRDSQIFYIGKGVGNRVYEHAQNAISTYVSTEKLDRIRNIIAAGFEVEHYILSHDLTEEVAYTVERACIDLIGLNNLSNEVSGHHSYEYGYKRTVDLISLYECEKAEIIHNSILININRLYGHNRTMTKEELYEATRKSWKVGNLRNNAKYAMATYKGIIREVYEIDSWEPIDKRWGFVGKVAPEDIASLYRGRSIHHYQKQGSQNPIKYVFQ